VLNFCHNWKPTVPRAGNRNKSTKNELKRPRNKPPNGEAKNPIMRTSERAPLAISAISFFPPPPPGGRLYMDNLVVEVDDEVRLFLRTPWKDLVREFIVFNGESGDVEAIPR